MKTYKEVNGTSYSVETSSAVIEVLERCRANKTRIVVDYGNVETKESFNEVYDISGYVGRSNGSVKVPLLVHNKRSLGGGCIMTDCILFKIFCFGFIPLFSFLPKI